MVEVVGKEGDATFSMIDERLLRERCGQLQPLVASLRDAMRLTGLIKHSASMVFGAKREAESAERVEPVGAAESITGAASVAVTASAGSGGGGGGGDSVNIRQVLVPAESSPKQLQVTTVSSHISSVERAHLKPVAEASSNSSSQSKHSSSGMRLLRCLVVDDSKPARKMLTHMLEKRLGHTAVEANDGAEACRLVEEAMRAFSSFDIVFLDCEMPGMDGPTAARQIVAMGFRGKIVGFTHGLAGRGHGRISPVWGDHDSGEAAQPIGAAAAVGRCIC